MSMEEVRKGYKKTDIGVIPEDWEVKEIGSLLKIGNGRDYKHLHWGDVPVFGTGGLITYVDDCLYDGDTVCIGRKGTIDKPLFHSGKLWTVDTLFYTYSFNDCVPKFIFYLFNTIAWREYNEATGVPSLSQNIISKINVGIPKLIKEQTAIATALSDMDSLISALNKKIVKKRAIKQGLMQQLLTGKKRLPGFSEEWCKDEFSKLANILRGGSPRPIEQYIVKTGGVNWIKIGDVERGAKYICRTKEQIHKSGIIHSRYVYEGDLLLSNSMSFGRPYILKTEGCIHDGWLVIQDYARNFDKEFLYYLLSSEDVFRQYVSLAAGSSVLNLNKEIVGKVVLKYPQSLSEQTAIATILSDCDKEISSLEEKRDKYQELKQGMMQQLLTGKIRLV